MNLPAVQTLDSIGASTTTFLTGTFCTKDQMIQLEDDESRLSFAVRRSHPTGNCVQCSIVVLNRGACYNTSDDC